MALKAGYYGLKRSLLNKVKALPGIKSIGAGLFLNPTTGELEATGTTISVEANPEGAATENLVKLGLGETVYAIPDAAKTYQTNDETESAIVDADYVPFFDSSAELGSGAPKKSTWSNFISKIKAKITEYVTWEANAKTGVHNQFPYPYVGGIADGGIFTVNADKTITASGTFTSNSEYKIMDYVTDNRYEGWIISSNAGYNEDFYIRIREVLSDGTYVGEIKETNGQIIIPHMVSGHKYYIACRVGTIGSAIDVTINPTLSVPDDTYRGYTEPTMTNKELTEKLTTKDVTVTAGTDVTVNANTHVYSKAGVVTGSLRLEIGATLTAGATIATLSATPKNTTYAIGIDNTDKSVIPIIIGNNGAVQLFGGFIPTSGNQLLIPIAYATA